MGDIIIRKARVSEIGKTLGFLHFIAYKDRFFNKEVAFNSAIKISKNEKNIDFKTILDPVEFGGYLGINYRDLIPNGDEGQSLESFNQYWDSKKNDFENGKFITYVAEDKKTNKLVGFVKGDYSINSYGSNELGSIYIDPNYKGIGLGFDLVKKYFTDIIEKNPNCNGIMTDCYIRNNSQYFFNRLGATFHSFCSIPNLYLTRRRIGILEQESLCIGGEMMSFSRKNIEDVILAKNSRCLPKPTEKYTRDREFYKQVMFNIQKYSALPPYLGDVMLEETVKFYNSKIEENKLIEAFKDMDNVILKKYNNKLSLKRIS